MILILSLAGLIVITVRKIPQAVESSKKEKKKEEDFNEAKLRVFGFQKKILTVVEKLLGAVVALALKVAMITSRLSGRVKIRSREVHKASDFVTSYFEKLKKRKSLKNLNKEERECIQLIKEDPSNVDAYRRLGNNYISRGNYKEAKLSFEQALRLKPDDEEAKVRLGEIDEATTGK